MLPGRELGLLVLALALTFIQQPVGGTPPSPTAGQLVQRLRIRHRWRWGMESSNASHSGVATSVYVSIYVVITS